MLRVLRRLRSWNINTIRNIFILHEEMKSHHLKNFLLFFILLYLWWCCFQQQQQHFYQESLSASSRKVRRRKIFFVVFLSSSSYYFLEEENSSQHSVLCACCRHTQCIPGEIFIVVNIKNCVMSVNVAQFGMRDQVKEWWKISFCTRIKFNF